MTKKNDSNVVSINEYKVADASSEEELTALFDFLKELKPDEVIILSVKDDDVYCASSSFQSRLKMLGAAAAITNFLWNKDNETVGD